MVFIWCFWRVLRDTSIDFATSVQIWRFLTGHHIISYRYVMQLYTYKYHQISSNIIKYHQISSNIIRLVLEVDYDILWHIMTISQSLGSTQVPESTNWISFHHRRPSPRANPNSASPTRREPEKLGRPCSELHRDARSHGPQMDSCPISNLAGDKSLNQYSSNGSEYMLIRAVAGQSLDMGILWNLGRFYPTVTWI